MRALHRQLLVWLFAGSALFLGTGTAFAHDILVGSDPANGASLATGPSKVSLTFDLPVKEYFSTITVVGPDGEHYEGGPSSVDGSTVSAPVQPLGPVGTYTIGYRIVSDDGHPVSGAIRFSLTQAGPGHGVPAGQAAASNSAQASASSSSASSSSSAPSAPAAAAQDQSDESGSGGIPAWPWVLGGVVLVAAGAVVALRLGKGS